MAKQNGLQDFLGFASHLAHVDGNGYMSTIDVLRRALSLRCACAPVLHSHGIRDETVDNWLQKVKVPRRNGNDPIQNSPDLDNLLKSFSQDSFDGLTDVETGDILVDCAMHTDCMLKRYVKEAVGDGFNNLAITIHNLLVNSNKFVEKHGLLINSTGRSRMTENETSKSELLAQIEKTKADIKQLEDGLHGKQEQMIRDLEAIRNEFVHEKAKAIDDVKYRLQVGAEALNMLDGLGAIITTMDKTWSWAEKYAKIFIAVSLVGLAVFSIFLFLLIGNMYQVIERAENIFNNFTLLQVLGRGVLSLSLYSTIIGSIAKSVLCMLFLALFYKMLMAALSVLFQCRNKRSMATTLHVIYESSKGKIDTHLAELIYTTAREIVKPIEFKSINAKIEVVDNVKETLDVLKSVKEVTGGESGK